MKLQGILVGLILLVLIVGSGFYFREGSSNLGGIGAGNSGGVGASGVMSQSLEVEIVDEIPTQRDGFTINSVKIEGKELVVDVSYSACETHVFNMYSTAGQGFMESNPVQTNIYFVHDAIEEVCDAAIVDEVYRFDLQPLIDEYVRAYGMEDQIIMNFQGFDSVYYVP